MTADGIFERQGPFVTIPIWVLRRIQDNSKALHVYAVLVSYADSDGYCWPSRASVADFLQCDEKTVSRATAFLEAKGAIEVLPQTRSDGSRTTNGYRLLCLGPGTPVSRGVGTPVSQQEELESVVTRTITSGRTRKVDPLWEAFTAALPEPVTSVERGKWNKGLKAIRDAGGTPEQCCDAIVAWREKKWPGEPNPMAVAANWTTLVVDKPVQLEYPPVEELYPGAHLMQKVPVPTKSPEDIERGQAAVRELQERFRARERT